MHQKNEVLGGGHLGSHDLETRSQGHVNIFLKGLIVALNNQEVFWPQNYPENRSNISPKTFKKTLNFSSMHAVYIIAPVSTPLLI
jgi:hypothetical protein